MTILRIDGCTRLEEHPYSFRLAAESCPHQRRHGVLAIPRVHRDTCAQHPLDEVEVTLTGDDAQQRNAASGDPFHGHSGFEKPADEVPIPLV